MSTLYTNAFVNSAATTSCMSNVFVNNFFHTASTTGTGNYLDRWETIGTNSVTAPYYWATATNQLATVPTAIFTANLPTNNGVAVPDAANLYLCGDGTWTQIEATWTAWNANFRPYTPPLPQIVVPSTPQVDPAAQLLRDAARRREEEREKKAVVARATARKTLRTLLDDRQKEQLEREGLFDLRIDDRVYRVRPGNTVQQLDAAGKVLCSFCIHPFSEEWIPEDDHAIAQKLLLEADEALFLQTANRRNYA